MKVLVCDDNKSFTNTVSNFFLTSITETLLEGGEVEYEQ